MILDWEAKKILNQVKLSVRVYYLFFKSIMPKVLKKMQLVISIEKKEIHIYCKLL